MIEWLDDERRRDRQTISTLEERLVQQSDLVESLLRRLNLLESDQSVIRSEYVPTASTQDTVDQLRREMRQMIEQVEAKRLTTEREQLRLAELNREQVLKTQQELHERVDRVARQTTELPVIQHERDRVAQTIGDLQARVEDLNKRFEDPDRRLAYLEEQRRQDTRRVTELETQIMDQKKGLDGVRPKLALVEDLSLRNERRIQDVTNTERERREQMQQFIDQQTLMFQQRDQEVASLLARMETHDATMEQNIQRFETWSEAYRAMKQIIDDFHRIGERLERRINEVAEMQRLSEERFRQEWNSHRSDDQKRWKQYTISSDEVWRRHDDDFSDYVKSLQGVQDELPVLRQSLTRLWQLERDRVQLYGERTQALLSQYDVEINSGTPSVTTPPKPNGGNGIGGG